MKPFCEEGKSLSSKVHYSVILDLSGITTRFDITRYLAKVWWMFHALIVMPDQWNLKVWCLWNIIKVWWTSLILFVMPDQFIIKMWCYLNNNKVWWTFHTNLSCLTKIYSWCDAVINFLQVWRAFHTLIWAGFLCMVFIHFTGPV